MNLWINRINTALAVCFYALVFLVPLVVYSHSYELFEFNKMWVTFGITIVIVFLWISKMILLRRIVFRRTPLDIPLLIFLISQFLSTIISLDTHISIWGYYSRFNGGFLSILAYILLYYAMASNLIGVRKNSENSVSRKTQNKIKYKHLSEILSFLSPQSSQIPFSYKLLLISLLSGIVVVAWGLPSHFGYDPTCLLFRGQLNVECWTEAFQPTVRMFSTLGQPNWLGAYLSILLFPLIALFLVSLNRTKDSSNTKNNESRIMNYALNKDTIIPYSLFIILILFYLCLTWTKSQSAFLGFWAGFVVFVGIIKFISWKKEGIDGIKFWKNPLLKTCAIIAGMFVAFNLLVGFPIERLNTVTVAELIKKQIIQPKAPSAETALSDVGGTNSGKIRLIVWRGAIDVFKHNPILGSGVETFAYSYYKYRPIEHNQTSEWDYLYNKAHNEYLNYAATTGILGIGSYLFIIGLFFWTCGKYILGLKPNKVFRISENNRTADPLSFLSSPNSTLLALSLISSYVSILISNFFGFSVVIVNIFFFLIPIMTYELLGFKNLTHTAEFKIADQKVSLISRIGVISVGVITIYLLATLLKYWEADKAYALGYNLDRLGEFTSATQELVNATKLRPTEPIFRDELSVNLGTLALIAAQNNEATQAAELARQSKLLSDNLIKHHPNNVTFYKTRTRTLYSLSQINPNYLDDAIESINKAAKLAPTDPKIKYNQAVFYGKSGDSAKAITLLKQTIQEKDDYYDAYYALAVFYIQEAQNATNSAEAKKYNDAAKSLLEYSLKYLSPDNPDAKRLLETIK